MTDPGEKPLLEVQNLKVYFHTKRGIARAVDDVSFSLRQGEALGLVGESGSGKSVTCLSIVGLVQRPAGRIAGGRILFQGSNLLDYSDVKMREIRGQQISMILQDPMTSLNPVFTIGAQVAEPLVYHGVQQEEGGAGNGRKRLSGLELREKVVGLLQQVRIPSAAARVQNYPHQFSGGMKQRVVGAIAIACAPRLLIADEPTTALDVTVQAQILRLLKEIQVKQRVGMIMVTHDLGVVAKVCDRMAVMYAGRIVEYGDVQQVFEEPAHPYTLGLLNSIPRLGASFDRLRSITGQPPDLMALPEGCSFSPRCSEAKDICFREAPAVTALPDGRAVRCWLRVAE